jgi:hypothetical protein
MVLPASVAEQNLQKFKNWESSIVSFGDGKPWFAAKYFRPHPPNLFTFIVYHDGDDCENVNFLMQLFRAKRVNYQMNNIVGYIKLDGKESKFMYTVFQDNDGTFMIPLERFENQNIVLHMMHGNVMKIYFPRLSLKKEINLSGFTKAIMKASEMCARKKYGR